MSYSRLSFCQLLAAGLLVAPSLFAAPAQRIACPGGYGGHLQGIATDGANVYWSFTTEIVKTDGAGKLLATQKAPSHQGDLCYKDGVVYVAVNRGRFNHEKGAVSEVRSYDAQTLKHLKTWPLPEMPHGAGGMTWRGDRFFVVGGLPATHECNYVYEYTRDFAFVKRHDLKTGFTLMGIQTAAYEEGRFLFGIYGGKGNPDGVLAVQDNLSDFTRHTGPGSVGILRLAGDYYVGVSTRDPKTKRNTGHIRRVPDFCGEKTRYAPPCKGGRVRFFFSGRDAEGWSDCGYVLVANGYRPLTQYDAAFRPVSKAAEGPVPAVSVSTATFFSLPDLVRGVRRAAEQNEEIAYCLPGTLASVAADARLSQVLSALLAEAKRLRVPVSGLTE